MRFLLLGLIGLPFIPIITRADHTETVDETRPLVATGEVVVENVNGPVVIETWDRPEVHLVAVKSTRSRADLEALEVKIDATGQRFTVQTVYRDKDGSWLKKFTNTGEVRYTLTVPHTAALRKVETVNGSITLANIGGRATAKTVNGGITAHGLRDEAELASVNGGITAAFDVLLPRQDIAAETVNGDIEIRIPDGAGAEVSASTGNGAIRNDFDLPVRSQKWAGHELDATLGDGAARIRLRTVNGRISLLKH